MSDNVAAGPVLPTVVIGGYLGAGKTTLVNRLLRQAAQAAREAGAAGEPAGAGQGDLAVRAVPAVADGAGGADAGKGDGNGERRRIAVLVNDFGEVSIDADLIVGAEGGVLSLAGGCVCCSFGADLVGALEQLAARVPRPQVVLIETSGVGLPASVARTAALMPQVRVEGIVVVADVAAVRRQAAERYVGSTVRRQLQEADLVLLGKADLAEPDALPAVEAWLRDSGIAAPRAALPAPGEADDGLASLVFGPSLGARQGELDGETAEDGRFSMRAPRAMRPVPSSPAASRFVTNTHRYAEPVDVAAMGEALRAQGVLRAKGLLLDASGQWQELQVAGGRVHRRPASAPAGLVRPEAGAGAGAGAGPGAPDATTRGAESAGRLVTISLRRA